MNLTRRTKIRRTPDRLECTQRHQVRASDPTEITSKPKFGAPQLQTVPVLVTPRRAVIPWTTDASIILAQKPEFKIPAVQLERRPPWNVSARDARRSRVGFISEMFLRPGYRALTFSPNLAPFKMREFCWIRSSDPAFGRGENSHEEVQIHRAANRFPVSPTPIVGVVTSRPAIPLQCRSEFPTRVTNREIRPGAEFQASRTALRRYDSQFA